MIGVYHLSYKGKVVYIGQTKHWPSRLAGHTNIKFDTATLIKCRKADLNYNEKKAIMEKRPPLNHRYLKKAKDLLTDSWVLKNWAIIQDAMKDEYYKGGLSKICRGIGERAKRELGYSLKTNSFDIWATIRRRANKIPPPKQSTP